MSVDTAPPATEEHVGVVVRSEQEVYNDKEMDVQATESKNWLAVSDKKELVEIQNEMIPEELLFALTTAHTVSDKEKNELSPIKDLKTPERLRMAIKKGPPSGVWHHKGRRTHFKHLTDNPRSLGKGVGTRDVSFLYDIANQQMPVPPRPSKLDKSAVRLEAEGGDLPKVGRLRVPDTVIPEEYHLVKTKAVQGLEYIDEKQTTLTTDRDQALRVFPSLHPTKRFEVIQLLQTLDTMLEQSGVLDDTLEVRGPTQIHNLLELIKKEQNIYDLVFSEVIRQVSVECLERGQLLSELRIRYADLLNRVPRQIQSLHAEVMAQRSLDRRLTEELLRFKTSIAFLTTELQTVREHDHQVTIDAEAAEAELAKALQESQTNANLVDEYHDLYELQRRRLEANVTTLTSERDLWSNAAYSLALKITSINSLNTAKRLHVSEKAWSKLSNHFVVMLSDHDSDCLTKVQKHVEKWRETMFHFNQELEAADKRTVNLLRNVKVGLDRWATKFDENLVSNNADAKALKQPPKEFVQDLCDFLKTTEEALGSDGERFAGGQLLANEEKLSLMTLENHAWTDLALEIYRRHKSENGDDFPLCSTLKNLNTDLHDLTKQLDIRITGENGLARMMMNVQNGLDSFVNKLFLALHSGGNLSDKDWWGLYDTLLEYDSVVSEAIERVGSQQADVARTKHTPHTHISVEQVMKGVQDWMKENVSKVEAEDGKMLAQVSSIHSDLVHWMVQMLLHLVPNYDNIQVPPDSSMLTACSRGELVERARNITRYMSQFTEYFWQCCIGIVHATMQEKKDRGDDDADHEYRDFLRVKREAKEWIRTCEFLLNSILPNKVELLTKDLSEKLRLPDEKGSGRRRSVSRFSGQEAERRTSAMAAIKAAKTHGVEIKEDIVVAEASQGLGMSMEGASEKEDNQEAANEEVHKLAISKETSDTNAMIQSAMSIQVLGQDENVRTAHIDETDPRMLDSDELPSPSSALMQNAYDAIAKMDQIQNLLLRTEIRAQDAEQKVIELEEELNLSSEKIRALQKSISDLEARPVSSVQSSVLEMEEAARQDAGAAAEKTGNQSDSKSRRGSPIEQSKRGSTSRGSNRPKKQSFAKKK